MIVYRIAATTPLYRAEDISGAGAAISGGRWNPITVPMLYCTTTLALGYLESLVHINLSGPMPRNRYRIEVAIPDVVWVKRRIAQKDSDFPADWDAHPAGKGSVDYAAKWVAASTEAVLVIPSVIIPQEDNVLVNPRHADFAAIHAVNRGRVEYDHRLFAGVR